MNDFSLSEMEMNMSFTDLLNRAQMSENYGEDTSLGVGLNVVNEPIVSLEVPLNEIDYDENGSDIDDDEIIDARTKHKKNEMLEKESQHELERLGEQLQRDNVRYDIDSDYDDEFDVHSPTASSDEDEYGYLTTPACTRQDTKSQKAKVNSLDWIDTTFSVEQKFENAVEFRKEIIDYCARNGVDVKYTKNHKNKVGVRCKDDNCKWKIWASIPKNKRHFEVKTYHGVHSCGRKNKVKKITYKWIPRHYLSKFKSNPYMKLQEITDSVWNEHGLKVSVHMAFRAKKCALNLIVGEYKEQYGMLNSYAAEIYRSDHNNTIKFQLNANVFHRMYICFATLKEGFLAGCRPFISIDGCWFKGPYGGQLLVAVGRDENNQMFPIAWAVVDVENTESWSWFLQLLAEDLQTSDGAGYTVMSDQQKGLLKAVAEMWPQAEQRVCARHVYMNFREVFGGGQEYRMHFWKIAKSTTPNEFKENVDKLHAISPEAAANLMGRNYEKWCRAFYTPQCQCDAVDNNMSEVFNAFILNSRHKPIITMLEDIRESIMERLHKKRDFIRSKNLAICPRAQEQLEKAKIAARGWNAAFGGRFTIDLFL
ncbi:uncharacterized protein LOC141597532 [Silene latifolia]|uniref:uncharacterized protein LOC141597532 n=1 Tax=Silene latifolia TaxID=37657 RepID=UPI003D77E6D6